MQWNDVLSYYEQLISEGFDYAPQLQIAKKIVNSEFADSLFPTLSHFALNVSRINDFQKSFDYPSICVQYSGEEKFIITYSPKLKHTHNMSELHCNIENVWSYLESLFLRQKIETNL